MKLLHQCLVFGAIAMGAASCSQEAPWSTSGTGEGSMKLNLSVSADLQIKSPSTRAQVDLNVPPASEFSISVRKLDGTYSKTFLTLADFEKESEFHVGAYEVEAFYGSPDSQGTAGANGYENSYFYGITKDVTVVEGTTTNVDISPSLANSAISVEYTDAFKNYFTKWSTSFKSDNHETVDFGSSEGLGFITPGEVNIIISATLQNGKELTFNPASFQAVAQYYHKVKYDVNNGEIGNAQLTITFEDTVEEVEEIVIDLSDEVINASEPVATVNGVVVDENFTTPSIEVLEGVPFEDSLSFGVVARAGMKQAVLSVDSKTSSESLDYLNKGSIDLCTADESQQARLAENGIIARGFFSGSQAMSHLDLSGITGHLKPGEYKITLNVTDNFDKSCNEASVNLIVCPLDLTVTATSAVFGEGYADITINYNGYDPTQPGTNPFSFKILKNAGTYEDAVINSINGNPYTRAFDSKSYTYRISLPEIDRDEILTQVYFGKESPKMIAEPKITFTYPEYSLELDAFAKSLRFRVEDPTSDESIKIAKRLKEKVYLESNGNTVLKHVEPDANGIMTISDLTPGTDYILKTTLRKDGENLKEFSFKTEEALEVPNGDFEDLIEEPTISATINQGGEYTRTLISSPMQNTQTFKISEPIGWVSINSKTCNLSSNPGNSWFVVPSVYSTNINWTGSRAKQGGMGGGSETPDYYKKEKMPVQNGNYAVVVRNVAWSHNGKLPEVDKDTKIPSTYFSENKPTIEHRSAGKIFLGNKYSYISNTEEIYDEGIVFSSRPSKLSGYYKYVQDPKDKMEKATIKISIHNNNRVIVEKLVELDPVDKYTLFEIPFLYEPFEGKAELLKIMISSSNHIGTIAEESAEIQTTDYCELYRQESIGAQLIIDNLSFEY